MLAAFKLHPFFHQDFLSARVLWVWHWIKQMQISVCHLPPASIVWLGHHSSQCLAFTITMILFHVSLLGCYLLLSINLHVTPCSRARSFKKSCLNSRPLTVPLACRPFDTCSSQWNPLQLLSTGTVNIATIMMDPWVPLYKSNLKHFFLHVIYLHLILNRVKYILVCSFGLETKLISFPDVNTLLEDQ